jgi:hypothetical protein
LAFAVVRDADLVVFRRRGEGEEGGVDLHEGEEKIDRHRLVSLELQERKGWSSSEHFTGKDSE